MARPWRKPSSWEKRRFRAWPHWSHKCAQSEFSSDVAYLQRYANKRLLNLCVYRYGVQLDRFERPKSRRSVFRGKKMSKVVDNVQTAITKVKWVNGGMLITWECVSLGKKQIVVSKYRPSLSDTTSSQEWQRKKSLVILVKYVRIGSPGGRKADLFFHRK